MTIDIGRRGLVAGLGGLAVAWPLHARAQQRAIPVVGYLSSSRADTVSDIVAAFREGLAATGFVDSKDVSIEHRWADRHLERLPALALDLVQRRVNVIFAAGDVALRAVQSATPTIPVIAVDLNSDPVDSGMVASLAYPGRNITGIFLAFADFATKWLELLKEATLRLSRVAILWDPSTGQLQKKLLRARHRFSKYRLRYWRCELQLIWKKPLAQRAAAAWMACSF